MIPKGLSYNRIYFLLLSGTDRIPRKRKTSLTLISGVYFFFSCFLFCARAMQRLVVLVAFLAAVVVAQPSLVIQTPATIWAGVNPPPQQITLNLPAVVPPPPGGIPPLATPHYPVTINPTASAGITVVPASIVLNDANHFTSTYQIIVGQPPTFGPTGTVPQPYNISWDAVSDFVGYSNLDKTTGGVVAPRKYL